MAGLSELDALLDLVGAGDDLLFGDKNKKKKPEKESIASIGAAVAHAVHTKHLVEKAAHLRFGCTPCFLNTFVNLFFL